jgi:hypothetical protein
MENLSKNSNLDNNEINYLREKFIQEYSMKKGWDPKNLTPTQVLEIAQQKEYKNPGLILG